MNGITQDKGAAGGPRAVLSRAVTITSRQNPTVSETASLGDKKRREASGMFLLDGIKLALEAVSSGLSVRRVLLSSAAAEKYADALSGLGADVGVYVLSEVAFSRVTDEKAPEGVVTVVGFDDSVRRGFSEADAAMPGGRLVLDGVQSPENFGAILRSARAFGIRDVISGPGCADVYGRRVMRSSMGAALRVGTVTAESAADACRALSRHGHRIVAAVPKAGARDLGEFEFLPSDCLVIGNEGHGISAEVEREASEFVRIPMVEGQESLNAACAAAVLLWEMRRGTKKETSNGT